MGFTFSSYFRKDWWHRMMGYHRIVLKFLRIETQDPNQLKTSLKMKLNSPVDLWIRLILNNFVPIGGGVFSFIYFRCLAVVMVFQWVKTFIANQLS